MRWWHANIRILLSWRDVVPLEPFRAVACTDAVLSGWGHTDFIALSAPTTRCLSACRLRLQSYAVFILAPLHPGGIRYSRGTKYRRPKGRVFRPEGPDIEDQRAESGDGVLGEGQLAPPHQLGGLGSAASSLCGVWGGAPAEIELGVF